MLHCLSMAVHIHILKHFLSLALVVHNRLLVHILRLSSLLPACGTSHLQVPHQSAVRHNSLSIFEDLNAIWQTWNTFWSDWKHQSESKNLLKWRQECWLFMRWGHQAFIWYVACLHLTSFIFAFSIFAIWTETWLWQAAEPSAAVVTCVQGRCSSYSWTFQVAFVSHAVDPSIRTQINNFTGISRVDNPVTLK